MTLWRKLYFGDLEIRTTSIRLADLEHTIRYLLQVPKRKTLGIAGL